MSKESLIAHLVKTGKTTTESWDELAKKHGLDTGETARNIWKRHKKRLEKIEKKTERANYIADLEARIESFEENIKLNTGLAILRVPKAPQTLAELEAWGLIDTSIWSIDRYVQNFWGNDNDPRWQVKAWLSKKSDAATFQEEFIKFLEEYEPSASPVKREFYGHEATGCLVINKQDAHLNKFDINGNNDIEIRFSQFMDALEKTLNQAYTACNLEKAIYIIGSDEFNSEWAGMTVKGTPQQNILSYQDSFKLICEHEVEAIQHLLKYSNEVEVIYIPGNHDEYVGFHLIHWLSGYFKTEPRLKIDISVDYTKCSKFGTTAIMMNHGDEMKPAKLAGIFPIEFKDEWSSCEYYYIFTGDKHHTLAQDFNGIEFHQIPALSHARSKWDSKKGHQNKAYLTSFLIEKENGLTNIIKQPIK